MECDKVIKKDCVHCEKEFEIHVNKDDYKEWTDNGTLIQQAMPYLTPGERELLISGTCDECWDRMFGDNDEEEEVEEEEEEEEEEE